jgi:CubicO group peptidase (beta-lactamase class C family)
MTQRNKVRTLLFWLLPLTAVLSSVGLVAARADEVDDYVQAQMRTQHVPGLALAVIQNGQVVKEKGYGLADVERSVPVTPDTVFELGSITKQFTATAIMMLVEQDNIRLDDPLARFLTGLPDDWRGVTIRQLLSHTSGVPDFEAIMGYGGYRNVMSPAEIIALAAGKGIDFPPGTHWNYSNTGYYLLTMLLEKVSGETYAHFVQAHILTPLGMTHTRSSEPTAIIPNRSAGYAYENGRLENRDPMQPTASGGAGMLVSTVGDLVKWDASLSAQTLLRKSSYEQMWTDTVLTDGTLSGYGFGWFVSSMHGHRSQEHSGGTAGFTTDIRRLPEDHLTVIVLTNCYQETADPAALASHIAQIYVPGLAAEEKRGSPCDHSPTPPISFDIPGWTAWTVRTVRRAGTSDRSDRQPPGWGRMDRQVARP